MVLLLLLQARGVVSPRCCSPCRLYCRSEAHGSPCKQGLEARNHCGRGLSCWIRGGACTLAILLLLLVLLILMMMVIVLLLIVLAMLLLRLSPAADSL